jgi:PAS domain S-box-containing protein
MNPSGEWLTGARPDGGIGTSAAAGQTLGALAPRVLADVPRLLPNSPAAVLVVDLVTRRVTFANDRGRQMVDGAPLPLGVEEWAALARLRGTDGAPLTGSASPVARVASGEQLRGELVVGTAGDGVERMLWVTGLPLDEAPGLATSGLVVLLDLSTGPSAQAAPDDAPRALRERAVIAVDISFSISDPAQPDNPLVWVNPAFTRVTGYPFEEAVGYNCRFLQGPDTDPAAVAELRRAQQERRPTTVTLLNYRADGTAFWNELSLSPVFDGEGALTHFVGVQADVTARVLAEQEREEAYAAEREARAEAERARAEAERSQGRLALVAEATSLLTATLDVDDAMERLANLAVPLLADWCTVDLVADMDGSHRVAVAHVDPEGAALVRRAQERQPRHRNPKTAAYRVLNGEDGVLLPEVTDDYLAEIAHDEEQLGLYRAVTGRSMMVVPLRARRQTLGVLTLATTAASERRFTTGDLELAKDLARRAALAVDNARLYTREHTTAEALQRSLLPVLPVVPGLSFAARYLASSEGAQVGGDWYDVLALPDGSVGVAIGDVMGHDLAAAVAMGQLRSVLRSYAWEGDPVGEVLDRMDRLVQGLEMAQLATAVYARLEPGSDGAPVMRYANAGHLPPLLREPDGRTRYLEGAASVLLGAPVEGRRPETAEPIVPGSTILLYTDGLVERRDAPLERGLDWLSAATAACDPLAEPEAICDTLVGSLREPLADDVALLAVRVEELPGLSPEGRR